MSSDDPATSRTSRDLHVDRPPELARPADLTVETSQGGDQPAEAGEPRETEGSTRERILVAASELFARRGYYGTSTRAVADAVGIRQPSMFHHFRSKSAVMKELLDIAVTPSHQRVLELADTPTPAAERLAQHLLEDARMLVSSRFNLLGLTSDDVLADPEFDDWREIVEALRSGQRRLVQQGVEAGEFVPVDPARVQVALGGLFGAALRPLRGPAEEAEAAIDELLFLVLRMLMRSPERAPQVLAYLRAR